MSPGKAPTVPRVTSLALWALASACASTLPPVGDPAPVPDPKPTPTPVRAQPASFAPSEAMTWQGEAPVAAGEDETPDTFWEAVKGGKTWLKLRYRFENVDDDAFGKNARASTLRTVLGYETAPYEGVSATVEFEDVSDIGTRNTFNSPTNDEPDRPAVVDPDGSEVNQAFLRYTGVEDFTVVAGRQRVILDNARFIGNVGWRQNEQTFDSASLVYDGIEDTKFYYAYFQNANRITGETVSSGDAHMDTHLVNASHELGDIGKLVGYWYYLDYDDSDALSTSTVGARFSGKAAIQEDLDAVYAVEFANQTDIDDNPNDVDANYILGEVGATISGVTAKVGFEQLEGGDLGDGDKFTTPLATGHKFNGWADKFLATPDEGLEDMYVEVSGMVKGAKWKAVYHDFGAEDGSDDYGEELDLLLSRKMNEKVEVGLKFADYYADDFAEDTTKFWVWIGMSI